MNFVLHTIEGLAKAYANVRDLCNLLYFCLCELETHSSRNRFVFPRYLVLFYYLVDRPSTLQVGIQRNQENNQKHTQINSLDRLGGRQEGESLRMIRVIRFVNTRGRPQSHSTPIYGSPQYRKGKGTSDDMILEFDFIQTKVDSYINSKPFLTIVRVCGARSN